MRNTDLHTLLPADVVETDLFQAAITHRSAGKNNNERLEFLGDAVLGLIIGHMLFDRYTHVQEGDLSRLRAYLVRKETLASVALENGLSHWLQLGSGEKKSGGFRRESILADSLEAIIGAVYLLKGLSFTQDFVSRLYKQRIQSIPSLDELKDAKTRLQEHLQSRQINLPVYTVHREFDEGDRKMFEVECSVKQLNIKSYGTGKSKRKAEQIAADLMLEKLLS